MAVFLWDFNPLFFLALSHWLAQPVKCHLAGGTESILTCSGPRREWLCISPARPMFVQQPLFVKLVKFISRFFWCRIVKYPWHRFFENTPRCDLLPFYSAFHMHVSERLRSASSFFSFYVRGMLRGYGEMISMSFYILQLFLYHRQCIFFFENLVALTLNYYSSMFIDLFKFFYLFLSQF